MAAVIEPAASASVKPSGAVNVDYVGNGNRSAYGRFDANTNMIFSTHFDNCMAILIRHPRTESGGLCHLDTETYGQRRLDDALQGWLNQVLPQDGTADIVIAGGASCGTEPYALVQYLQTKAAKFRDLRGHLNPPMTEITYVPSEHWLKVYSGSNYN